ncbi:dimethylsulfonioproprionate lyase family protein [Halomonas nitroreducens]|uniref:Dimethlysulfonioproprionate lyase DddL n=1 Tax=Halomonas nitroreducens TaxID=447425 RepID=A0A431V2E3_9GAMM|nr:dimethylsulfonioproprionate lyase family protein [Halomonas nitroreducens]RTR02948.1 dimethlysulfonioproprionate lyase DddL [Halomonas nitroreducens]
MSVPLHDAPDWLYLLREYDALYRHGSAGGSKVIRSHRRRVREALSAIIEANSPVEARKPARLPVVAHLGRALDLARRGSLDSMGRSLERVAPLLTWELGYSKISRTLGNKYAYAEILGPRGPVQASDLILLFAPNTTYPQHSHAGIEESYISIAGAWSENDNAVYAPGSLVLNRPGDEHRITTGQLAPCLLAYAWIGPRERLWEPGMTFTVTARQSRPRSR